MIIESWILDIRNLTIRDGLVHKNQSILRLIWAIFAETQQIFAQRALDPADRPANFSEFFEESLLPDILNN